MYPELFDIGPLTVYSYGLMLGIAFITASYFLTKEIERKKLDPNIATNITLLAIIFGVVGAKVFHLVENWKEFLGNPIEMAFSPGGLTFYGGLIFAIGAIWIYMKRKKIPFLVAADSAAPSLALAYGIGRIGCHLAGDGDYGIPTNLPWGTNYENGTVPPSAMFRGSEYAAGYPNGILPDNTPLHPTPVYEFFVSVIIFLILWKLRKKEWSDGKLFMFYLVFSGTARLLVEFIRLNPRLLLGLSEAQIISVGLIFIGLGGIVTFSKQTAIKKFVPPPIKQEHQKQKK
ncbi:MAG: prolipoprotein diacylglyceryl transferase [Ignavibacteriales bacterium]|nr:MAG: prolipoprotein diacylglyceryl transferase [Ignavibacteriales bacterium]